MVYFLLQNGGNLILCLTGEMNSKNNVILKCFIFYSAKEVIEIKLLSKKYIYIHRLSLIKFRRIYFLNKLLLTKNYLSNFKRKALKKGKLYKEPGVYIVCGNKKRGPYLKSIYR